MTEIPFIQAACYSPGRTKPITHIVIHAMNGTQDGTIAWFQNPASKVSAHYLISRKGDIVQMVKDADKAWAVCDANAWTLNIEHEDKWKNPTGFGLIGGCTNNLPWFTPVQSQASVKLVAALAVKYDVPLERIIGHNAPYLKQFKNNHQDPGLNFPWTQYRTSVAKEMTRIRAEAAVTPAPVETVAPKAVEEPVTPVKKSPGRPKKKK